MTQPGAYPQHLTMSPPVSQFFCPTGPQFKSFYDHPGSTIPSLRDQSPTVNTGSSMSPGVTFYNPCPPASVTEKIGMFENGYNSPVQHGHFLVPTASPIQRAAHSLVNNRSSSFGAMTSGRFTPHGPGSSRNPDRLNTTPDLVTRCTSGPDQVYVNDSGHVIPPASSATVTNGPLSSSTNTTYGLSNLGEMSSHGNVQGAGNSTNVIHGMNRQYTCDGTYAFSVKERANGYKTQHQHCSHPNQTFFERNGELYSSTNGGHCVQSLPNDLNFKPSGQDHAVDYNEHTASSMDSNHFLGSNLTSTKPYRSFSSELNSPDLPLPEDIDMDFGFPLSSLDLEESGFDSFMSGQRTDHVKNVKGDGVDKNYDNTSNTINNHNFGVSKSNGSIIHNYRNDGDNFSEFSVLANLKQESQDTMATCSNSYTDLNNSATNSSHGKSMKAEKDTFDMQFEPQTHVGTRLTSYPEGFSYPENPHFTQQWNVIKHTSRVGTLLAGANQDSSSVFPSHDAALNNQPGSFLHTLGSSNLKSEGSNFRTSDGRAKSSGFTKEDVNSARQRQTPDLEENDHNFLTSSYIFSYLSNGEDPEFLLGDTLLHHGDQTPMDKKTWMACKPESAAQMGWTFDQTNENMFDLQGHGDFPNRLSKFASADETDQSNRGYCSGFGSSPDSHDISSTTPTHCSNDNNHNAINGRSYGDSVQDSLGLNTFKLNNRIRMNSESGWQAMVTLIQQHKSGTESQTDLLRSAIDHIMQNRPPPSCIPSAKEIMDCSIHKKTKSSKTSQGRGGDGGNIHGNDRVDEHVMKKKKTSRGSTDEVSTTTSTPSPLAPSSSSPTAPCTTIQGLPIGISSTKHAPLASSTNESSAGSNVTSSSKPEKRRPSVLPPCRVCYSKASGLHYGVVTCEACNGFFRRSLKRGAIYLCSKDKNCDVKGKKRGECSHCRYQKCLAVGMSKSAVKTGRYSDKTRLAYAIETENQSKTHNFMSNLSGNGTVSESLSIHDGMGDNSVCPLEFESLDKRCKLAKQKGSGAATGDSMSRVMSLYDAVTQELPSTTWAGEASEPGLSKMKARLLEKWLRHYLRFAKNVPGFNVLHINDQITLVRASWQECWLLGSFSGYLNDIKHSAGQTDHSRQYSEVKVIFGKTCADLASRLWNRLQALNVTSEELTLIKMVSLTHPRGQRLEGPEQVQSLNWLMTQCLSPELELNHPDDPNALSEINSLLEELRTAPHQTALPSNGFKLRHSLTHETPILREIMTSSSPS